MKVKVSNLAFSNNQILVSKLIDSFPDAETNITGGRLSEIDLINFFYEADAIIVGLEKITESLIEKLPNLKIIVKFGVGLDNIDLNACKEKNITVGWTGGVNKHAVAEMALGYMISLSRNIYITSNQLKNSIWNKNGGFQLSGKKIGIIGYGNIGKELIRLLEPFNCKILLNDIIDLTKYNLDNSTIKITTKEEIYEESDIISIHTPLTSDTSNLFNKEVFLKMKKNAYIINTARGGIINENDLHFALINNIIAGAALDVYENEPPNNMDLISLHNLICTPHICGNSNEAILAIGNSALHHLINYKQNFIK